MNYLAGRLTVHVNQGDISARVYHALGDDETQTSSTSSDETDILVKGKGLESRLYVLTTRTADGLARELIFGRKGDFDVRVGLGMAARLVATRWPVVEGSKGNGRLAHQRRAGHDAAACSAAHERCEA